MKTYLKEWMEYLNISAHDAAESTSLSEKMFEKWIEGSTTPSVAQLDIISRSFGIIMDDLVHTDPHSDIYTANLNKKDETENAPAKTYLKEWTEYVGATVEEVAEKTGIAVEKVSSWMKEETFPDIIDACKLAVSFGLTLDDFISKDPKTYYKDYLEQHYFETTKHKVAIRVSNYLNKLGISNQLVVMKYNQKDEVKYLFIVRYQGTMILDPWDIVKISLQRKYRDSRERKGLNDEYRLKGMTVLDI